MFQLFQTKKVKELDAIIRRMESNIANNYKDNAQSNLKELQETYEQMLTEGKLNDKCKDIYSSLIQDYRNRLLGFTHKDQKPYWQ